MNDETELLASGYLDDALTDEERARAEADPEVMATVERMAELRRQLSVVERPNPARRDAAIKAALDVYAAERPPVAPPPVSSLSARRWSRWLMPAAAAALVAIVAGGIIATRGVQDGDDSAGGDQAASVAESAAGTTELQSGAQVLSDMPADTATSSEARDDGGAATTGAPEEAPAATIPVGSMYSATTDVDGSLQVIRAPRQLTRFAAQERSSLFRTGPCEAGTWLGRAVLQTDRGDVVVDVFLSEQGGRVRALDPASCEVLLSAQAP
jgi:hypothetical protein